MPALALPGARGGTAAVRQPQQARGLAIANVLRSSSGGTFDLQGWHADHQVTGDRLTGRLLGVQLFGNRHAEVAKHIDIAATAIFHGMAVEEVSDLDLSYTPPLGSPWEAIQAGAQPWDKETRAGSC